MKFIVNTWSGHPDDYVVKRLRFLTLQPLKWRCGREDSLERTHSAWH